MEMEEGETGREGESDSGSQYFLNSFASTQLGIKAIIPGLIPNPTELAAFRDKPALQSINKAGTQENSTQTHEHDRHSMHARCSLNKMTRGGYFMM